MSELLKFVKENDNWRELLRAEPYNIVIKEYADYAIFNYIAFVSDFSLDIVKEARGLIIDLQDMTIACRSFDKFFNLGEPNAADIKWYKAVAAEKIDGSLIRLWRTRANNVAISTSGIINAFVAEATEDVSFGGLVVSILNKKNFDYDNIKKGFTYVFELITPENKIVVDYGGESELYFLSAFDNEKGEIKTKNMFTYFKKPKEYEIKFKWQIKKMIKDIKELKEGFVVRDIYGNRVKIKTPQYVEAHKMRCNDVVTVGKIIKLMKQGLLDDFIGIFPEHNEKAMEVVTSINKFIAETRKYVTSLDMNVSKKDFAAVVLQSAQNTMQKSCAFLCYDDRNMLDNFADMCYNNIMKLPKNKIKEFIHE